MITSFEELTNFDDHTEDLIIDQPARHHHNDLSRNSRQVVIRFLMKEDWTDEIFDGTFPPDLVCAGERQLHGVRIDLHQFEFLLNAKESCSI
ncbi:hypothetical protein AVU38_gp053 [Ralstonia phage RSL2]|uniref:Uncharacterized protein n=1 Tax=Ralstonia phage RSL2 TaxID=1585840 RepID=A0A0A8JB48_9CAUD|nr:hypothetical protein AVU38_gp053 [Ralstonia phage RSL2]BAQ02581.1 hypothetical protein [Ralstonia phage RSL2]